MLDNCFEVDWANTRIQKLAKNEEDYLNLKKYMRSIYKDIKDSYKHYSCISPIGDIWAV